MCLHLHILDLFEMFGVIELQVLLSIDITKCGHYMDTYGIV